MAMAAYKDLCIDGADPALVAGFWGDLLGCEVELLPDGDAVLRRDGEAVVWVNVVPEPKAVKNRVHLDVWVPDDEDLLARGATLLARHEGFRVFADPEGNEWCAFAPPEDLVLHAPARVQALCTDSARPAEQAAWWAGVVGGDLEPGPDGALRYLRGAAGLGDVVWKFVPVGDVRAAKNRWHWDVTADVAELVAAGASVIAPHPESGWTVLADPEGNEFCAFASGA